jgi:hypothetical protein
MSPKASIIFCVVASIVHGIDSGRGGTFTAIDGEILTSNDRPGLFLSANIITYKQKTNPGDRLEFTAQLSVTIQNPNYI